mgnify:CR=1 FL=1
MRPITLKPPAGVFAAVQVETPDGTIVGAAPALHPDSSPMKQVAVAVRTDEDMLRLRWVHEDSGLGIVVMDYRQSGRRRLGGT